MKELKNIKVKEHIIDKKQMLVVYFDFSYPIDNENIEQITQTVSNILNEATNISAKFSGVDLSQMSSRDLYRLDGDIAAALGGLGIDITDPDADFKSTPKVDELMKDDKIQDPSQLELFRTNNDVEVIETNE